MTSTAASDQNEIKDFSLLAILFTYIAMFVAISAVHGVPSFHTGVLIPYAGEALAPLLIGLLIAAVYHGIRKGQSAWKRNTCFISAVMCGIIVLNALK